MQAEVILPATRRPAPERNAPTEPDDGTFASHLEDASTGDPSTKPDTSETASSSDTTPETHTPKDSALAVQGEAPLTESVAIVPATPNIAVPQEDQATIDAGAPSSGVHPASSDTAPDQILAGTAVALSDTASVAAIDVASTPDPSIEIETPMVKPEPASPNQTVTQSTAAASPVAAQTIAAVTLTTVNQAKAKPATAPTALSQTPAADLTGETAARSDQGTAPFTNASGSSTGSQQGSTQGGQEFTAQSGPAVAADADVADMIFKPADIATAAKPVSAATLPAPGTPIVAASGESLTISNNSSIADSAALRAATPYSQPASQIAIQISRAVQEGQDRLTVHLKPVALGAVTVNLEVGADNRLIAVIAAERPETLDLLQRDARTLERALQDAGLKTDSDSLNFSLQQQARDDSAGDDTGVTAGFLTDEAAEDAVPDMTALSQTLTGADSGVDIHV